MTPLGCYRRRWFIFFYNYDFQFVDTINRDIRKKFRQDYFKLEDDTHVHKWNLKFAQMTFYLQSRNLENVQYPVEVMHYTSFRSPGRNLSFIWVFLKVFNKPGLVYICSKVGFHYKISILYLFLIRKRKFITRTKTVYE